MSRFPDEVARQLKCYVYRLIDPRNNETFYIGKGTGNRVFRHAEECKSEPDADDNLMSPKLERIREIQREGLDVQYVIHRHGMDDATAFQVEASLIDAYPSLHNAVRGHHASVYGHATVEELLQRYNLPEIEIDRSHRLLAITINKLQGRRDPKVVFDLVRYCWALKLRNAEAVDYVIAVERGVALGVYKPLRWAPARAADFPDIVGLIDEPHRIAFEGERAPADVWARYVGEHGKRFQPKDLPPAQQACRYINR